MPYSVSFKTIGCRLNQAETAQINEQFDMAGWQVVDFGSACDVAVINTCTITQRAESDCAQWARRARRQGARLVVLAGCAVEHNGDALKAATGADLIADQAQKFNLPVQLAARVASMPTPPTAPSAKQTNPQRIGAPVFSTTRALVKVQDGCDFRCSYCIVPETRGAPRSRPFLQIIDEIQRLVDAGHREITLAAANLGCYRDPPYGLIDLLAAAESIIGLERLRIGSIESTTVEREIIDFMAQSKKLCRFLHLPLQSGDAEVLRRMQRRYTPDQYRATVEYAREKVPDIGLGTDVIVGFPGESEQAFRHTATLIESLPFSNLHVFTYSLRRGTPAAGMRDQIPASVRKARAAELIALGHAKRLAFACRFIGQPVTLLTEHTDNPDQSIGWTDHYLPVCIHGIHLPRNTLVTCVPARTEGDVLIASPSRVMEPVQEPRARLGRRTGRSAHT
ncbi:MAG TPA: hypothetical protein DCS43_02310 [Verrucomicrobia bacterium]|nr:hypothetical protein [Verrucomicrobiota bacterium]